MSEVPQFGAMHYKHKTENVLPWSKIELSWRVDMKNKGDRTRMENNERGIYLEAGTMVPAPLRIHLFIDIDSLLAVSAGACGHHLSVDGL